VGEWSIADTDCAVYVNSVGSGYPQIQYLTNNDAEVAGKVLITVISALAIPAPLAVQMRPIVLAHKPMQIQQIIAILTRNSSRITLLLRSAILIHGLICRELALNVLGDGSIGISFSYFADCQGLGIRKMQHNVLSHG
jgi:hypothetical protein